MLLQDSRISPIIGANAGWDYEYGLDSSKRITFLAQKISGINIQPIIVPYRFSYITRIYDFAGPIVGFYTGSANVTNSLLNGFETINNTPPPPPVDPLIKISQDMRASLAASFSYLSDDELDSLFNKVMLGYSTFTDQKNNPIANMTVINFWSSFEAEKKADLRTKMMYLPRYAVEDMIWEMLRPSYVGTGDAVYKASAESLRKNIPLIRAALTDISQAVIISNMLHLFNEANIEAMTFNNITDPYEWEKRKSEAYQKRSIDENLSKAVFNVLSPENADTYSRRQDLIRSFEKRIENLPQTTDKAIQLQRDTALAGFLAQENYEELNLLLYYYENLPSNIKQAMLEV